jgi:hypothetical protein
MIKRYDIRPRRKRTGPDAAASESEIEPAAPTPNLVIE